MSIKNYIATGLVLGATALAGCSPGWKTNYVKDVAINGRNFDVLYARSGRYTELQIGKFSKDGGMSGPYLTVVDVESDGRPDKFILVYAPIGSDLEELMDLKTLTDLEKKLAKEVSQDSTSL
jgi:hypothetical protein